MTTRCQPGDRCLVIADFPDCECNVGAHVTIDVAAPVPRGQERPPAWFFYDADRPLVALEHDAAGQLIKSWTDGEPHLPMADRPVFLDEHLVPLRSIGGASIDDVAAKTLLPT
jgi:hypothetical protein